MSLDLPGLEAEQARRLERAGFRSLESLLDADSAKLAELSGITTAQAQALLDAARRRLDTPAEPFVVEIPDAPRVVTLPGIDDVEGGPTRRLSRGLETARRIEETHDLVRRAREHAQSAPSTPARWKTRRQLKRLRKRLEQIQQRVLSKGIGGRAQRQLHALLDPLDDALRAFVGKRPKKRRLREIRETARQARKSLVT